MYYVYILFSTKLGRFYVGQTNDLQKRLVDHNRGASNFTANGCPWVLITSFDVSSRTEAIQLESNIKSRGIKRFLQDRKFIFPEFMS